MSAGVRVVDGTSKTCKGVIAGLEVGMQEISAGSRIVAIVADIPTRIDVHAWAMRKGHRIVAERRDGSTFRLEISKGTGGTGAALRDGGSAAVLPTATYAGPEPPLGRAP